LDIWLDFVAKIVAALVWPLTTVIVVFALRKSITALVPKIEEFNLGSLRMKIKQEIAEAKELAKEVNAQLEGEALEKSHATDTVSAESARKRQLASLAPEAAILAQWTEVEYVLKQLAEQESLNPRSPLSKILEQLVRAEVVDIQSAKLFKTLRVVRNEVAHTPAERIGLDTYFALDYLRSADTLLESLRAVLGQGS